MIIPKQLFNKTISQLTFNEMAFVHLNSSDSNIILKDVLLRSTLSFARQNVRHSLGFEYSKQVMPYIALCAILEQLGICYDRTDLPNPKYKNGIKRALYFFAELEEDNELIDILYSFRNGLLHNISLTSHDKLKEKYYRFRFSREIETVCKNAESDWNGDYETLDSNIEKYTTLINIEKFEELVFNCIHKADDLNQKSLLSLRLEGGVRQLYFDYIRTVPKEE